MNRLHLMSDNKLVNIAYCELQNLDSQRLTKRATDALNVVNDLDLDIAEDNKIFIDNCKHVVKSNLELVRNKPRGINSLVLVHLG